MLTGKGLEYEVESYHVFSNVNISVSQADKVGLIGPNGAGKTSLLRIMSGELQPTHGTVISDEISAGMLPQDLNDWVDHSVYDFMEEVTGVRAVKTNYVKAEAAYNANPDDKKALELYCDAAERLGYFGVDEFDGTVEKAMKRAGLNPQLIDREIGDLSGGQRTRVALAAIMANRYDVIMLDEPTNNLDMEGMIILERFIRRSTAAFLMVSHDRRFLRNATTRIVELLGGSQGVNNYRLGYDEYVEARMNAYESEKKRYEEHGVAVKALAASLRERRTRANSAESGGIKRSDNDKLGANHRAGRAAGHLARQAGAIETRLEQLKSDAPNKPQEPVSLDFMFEEGETITSQTLIDVENLVIAYDSDNGAKEFGPYNLRVKGGDRVAIVGANGAGKSTLVKAIMGQLKTKSGRVAIGSSARVAYIDQEQSLPSPDKTPIENLMALTPGLSKGDAIHLLVKFNLVRDNVDSMRAGDLSGGERAKVLLASVAAKKANILVLDEPTNNLDIPTIEGLQESMRSYRGAVVLVSHDRDFIDGINISETINL